GLHASPEDRLGWLAIGDCLEEMGQPDRAEAARLLVQAAQQPPGPKRRPMENRLLDLVALGIEPCVPVLDGPHGMSFVLVPPGTFGMGTQPEEEGHHDSQLPLHEVEISRPFYLARHPVTQEQYRAVTGSNPSWFSSTGGGASKVSDVDTQSFPVD